MQYGKKFQLKDFVFIENFHCLLCMHIRHHHSLGLIKDLYIVSKVLQGRFTKGRLIRSITLFANMSIEVKV